MASNISISVGADASQLRAELAVAQSSLRAYSKELSSTANAARRDLNDLTLSKVGQAASAVQGASDQVAKLKTQMEAAAKSGQVLNNSLHLNRGGLLELQASGVNAFQALASGMDVFRVATMEGAQVIGALIQGGLGGFGLIAAAATAAAGAVGYLALQAYQVKQLLGGTSAEFLLTGRGGGASDMAELNKAAEDLAKKFDLSKSSAAELISEIAKARTLGPDMVRMVAELAAAEGKVRRGGGESVTDVEIAKKLAAALNDGAAGAIKLANAYNVDTAAAEQMLKSGNELGAFRKVLADLAEHIRSHGGAWAEAKARADEYQRALNRIVGSMGELGAAGIAEAGRVAGPAPPWPSEKPTGGSGIAPDHVDNWEVRHNNFGGIRRPGVIAGPNAGGFMSYDMPEQGVAAIRDLLLRYQDNHGLKTLQGIISRWAPPNENDTEGLISRATKITGFGASQQLNLRDADTMRRVIEAMIRNEQGGKLPVAPEIIARVAGGGTGGAENQFAEKARREQQFKDIERDYEARDILNRNSLQRQVDDAQKKLEEEKALARDANKSITEEDLQKDDRVHKAQIDLNQKQAQLYDQDTQRQIAALKEKQAAAADIGDKIGLQRQVISAIQARGTGPQGGGVNLPQLDQERTALAALERQQIQQNFQLAEQAAGAQRAANADILRGYQAQQQEAVRLRQLSPLDAINDALQKSRDLAAENAAELNKLYAAASSNTDRIKIYWELWREGVRAATEQQQLLAQRAQETKAIIDKWVEPFKSAFDQIGSSIESGLSGLLTGSKNWGQALKDISNSAISSLVSGAGSILSKLAAKGLGAQAGEGLGEALFSNIAKSIGLGDVLGLGGQAASTAALSANTAALVANTVALGGSAAASAAGGAAAVAGGAASAAGSAGGLFGGITSLFSFLGFSHGGIVPSAAGGWALPSFAGAQPAMLHSREMVLPAPISEGIQSAIAGGGLGGGGDMHLHLHGLAFDGPAVERLFKNNGQLITDAVRTGLRSGRLTPRTI